jgi:O-antigen ligase
LAVGDRVVSRGDGGTPRSFGWFGGPIWLQARFYVLLAFLTLCLLGGGAARSDVLSLLYVRPAALLCLAFLLLSPGPWEFRRFRMPFVFLGLLAAWMLVQLIPLPPGLWASLPGHATFTEAAAAAGFEEPWRPISLSPDLTLNSLLALLPCLVVLVGLAGLREEQRWRLLPVLIAFAFADALMGIVQTVTGADSAAYLYKVTNNGFPVGFFSNRNHHAVLLALTFPLLAIWIGTPAASRQVERSRLWVALTLGLLLIPMILATGSRAGAIAGGLSLLIAYWCAPRFAAGWRRRWRIALVGGVLLVPILLVGLTMYVDRAASVDRVTDASQLESEDRLKALPVLTEMAVAFSPAGTGYGAFDPAFRVYEPESILDPFYFNHAHSDLLELAITGGAPALILLAAFLFWWLRQMIRTFAASTRNKLAMRYARLGGIIILILFGASLVDYPLRTPLLAALFAIACGWLALARGPSRTADTARDGAAAMPAAPGKAGWALRGVIALCLVAGLGWVTMGVTASLVFGRTRPALVLGWWPFDSAARATAAAQVLESARPEPDALAEAAENARAALRRSALNVVATRTLGLIAIMRGEEREASRLMRYSETLSRRDLPTQLWLIETNVQRNDIAGALLHYDHALRTSTTARDLLFPILTAAAANADVGPSLARLIAQRPPWWREFATHLIAEGEDPRGIESIIVAARLDLGDVEERGLLAGAIVRLVQLRGYEQANRLYRRARGADAALVRNGDFEAENRFVPLDWVLSETGTSAGIMEPQARGGRALLFAVQSGSGGSTVARQLLLLRPGRYRFSVIAGNISGPIEDRPRVTLACVQTEEGFLDLRLPPSPAEGRPLFQDFVVGNESCPAQWLIVHASDPRDRDGPQPWIDKVAVQVRP